MFYCEHCRANNKWPSSSTSSRGTCEVCGQSAACYDVSSHNMPQEAPAPESSPAPADWRTVVFMPDLMRSFLERLSVAGRIVEVDGNSGEITVDLPGGMDEYDLAITVMELKNELNSLGFWDSIDIERPHRRK